MANREEPEIHCVFVETNLDTRFTLPVRKDETISKFRKKLCEVHKQVFPEIGEINVSALKVKRREEIFYFSDYVNVFSAFAGISKSWYMCVDAVRVEKCELLRITAADQNLELVERKDDISIASVLADEDLETGVAEKKTRKRKLKSSDVETSRKKSSIALNQSVVASGYCVFTTRERGDDILMGVIEKDIVGEQKNNISMEENQQTSDADGQCQEKILTFNSKLAEEHISSKLQDVPHNQNLEEILETELAMKESNGSDESHKSFGKVTVERLDDLRGTTEQDLENGGKTAELVKSDHEKDTAPTLELGITSRDDVDESNVVCGDIQVGVVSMISPIGKGNEGGEPSIAKNLQTDEVVTHSENQMEASSGLTKRTKSSKDYIKQSAPAATTSSSKIVDEINEAHAGLDCAGATLKPCPISETPENPIVEAIEEDTEMVVVTVEDVGKNNMVNNNLQPENYLEANSGLTTSPVTEKEKTRKNSSKAATTTTVSREIVSEINGVPGNVDRVDSTSESCPISRKGNLGKENEMGEKINEYVGSGKTILNCADDIQTDNLVSYQENQLAVNSGLTTSPAEEKKKRLKKSSKDQINQKTTTSKDVLNEREKVSGSMDHVDATSEFEKLVDSLADIMQNENEMRNKFVDKVESISEDKIQDANNLQVTGLANIPHALVQESKTLDHNGKFMDENTSINAEHEVSKAKSVKSSKKKKSRKAKTPAKEDTRVDSGAQNVEPFKVVDGEGPDNVIRTMLDSLQQRNETEKILEKSRKKSVKRSKKTDSLNIVEAQVLDSLQQRNVTEENLKEIGKKSSKRLKKKHSSITVEPQESSTDVKNVAQEKTPPINKPKVSDV